MARGSKLKNSRSGGIVSVTVMLVLVLVGVYFGREGFGKENPAVTPAPIVQGSIELRFLDVGQGDSTLVRIPNGESYYTMLIDTGEKKYAQALEDYLRELGISRIDMLVNSHPHADHMGGMAYLIRNFEIGEIFMPEIPDELTPTTAAFEDMLDAILEKNLHINELCEGAYLDVPSEAKIEVYAPGKQSQTQNDLNNYSGILKLSYGSTGFLFTGDAEKALELETLEKEYDFHATVLKCGHHGSAGSSSKEFLQAIQPLYTVISCGVDNRYGHPSEAVLKRLEEIGTTVLRTDLDKTIIMHSDGTEITLEKGQPSIAQDEIKSEEEQKDAA